MGAICVLGDKGGRADHFLEHEDIADLQRILDTQRRKLAAGGSAIVEDTAFHAVLARATGNRVVMRIMETLNNLLIDSRKLTLKQKGRPERSIQGHEAVVAALAGDKNLGLHEIGGDRAVVRSVVYVDERANPVQRIALAALAHDLTKSMGTIVSVTPAPITFADAGQTIDVSRGRR